ncbi:multiple monosaccharide ABC transporter substrate-binding protein [Mycolicibacterium smegmatis]|uniref:ABC transporter n=2 Tax=Mycolicibacterium smegmatis (strain ATCC 700084 / mc(2)155) TaxID=246196 RepID=A0QT42_MYCS2|nr:multiple monosaccharide ABC transporter substrate-binding protein [Mycolicibacterium smegmatis]ABK76012.1 ABC transporter [Mycolicibacterium smegmatis MC2 155]AFP38136.1 ABC transporter sugar-binding protein [Mycolicibacterium smegmatis MC2 155]AIU06934.1 sugar ABC transporter substrate-binding protein [Mycolicibacterium smegmatis MC2 155]AIU13559.1 sugar ABC transporter substrate-binding protein [Mycolicibacterium smegmatis]AIU20183.1 sugar ABC transporter substrate-binding protein [Mycoli
MRKLTWLAALLAALAMAMTLSGCGRSAEGGGGGDGDAKGTVGIAMPTKSSERWVADGQNMVDQFKALGYDTDLQYGDDVVQNQVSQIENMITKGVKLLVIAPIDGSSLTNTLQHAADLKIPVISYDRLIKGTPNVDYYATFDNTKVGVLQANYIVDTLGVADGKGPFNLELFAGSPDDNNATYFFQGAMSVLQPYIDSGKLVVKSGQTTFDQIATLRWDGGLAQSRMDNLLSQAYTSGRVDAVLSPYDGISRGVISALKSAGYGNAAKPLPIVTGQDAELASVKSIVAGEQTQTVFKDTRELAKAAVQEADAVLTGGTPQVNDTETYDNGVKVVPSYLLDPVSVDKSNYKKVLIDSGYYTETQVQ